MVARLAVVLLVAASGMLSAPNCVVRSVLDMGGVTLARAVAESGPLSEQGAVSCFDSVVPSEIKPRRLLRLVIYTNESDMESYRGKGHAGAEVRSWDDWLKMLASAPTPRHAMAEVVQSPAGGVLRYRSADGQVSRSVIRGQDPTLVRAGRSTFEIIHMLMSGVVPGSEGKPGGGIRRLDVFLQSNGPLVERDCLRATQDLSKQLDVPWLGTFVRRDPFFIASTTFPVLHPLIKLPPLPTEQEYLRGGMIGCEVRDGRSWGGFLQTPHDSK